MLPNPFDELAQLSDGAGDPAHAPQVLPTAAALRLTDAASRDIAGDAGPALEAEPDFERDFEPDLDNVLDVDFGCPDAAPSQPGRFASHFDPDALFAEIDPMPRFLAAPSAEYLRALTPDELEATRTPPPRGQDAAFDALLAEIEAQLAAFALSRAA